jgi:hypothetical protein
MACENCSNPGTAASLCSQENLITLNSHFLDVPKPNYDLYRR